jgi:uncharacterized membrane protein (UPF0127 family)
MPSFLNPLIRNPSLLSRLRNRRNGAILATRIVTAFDSQSRRTGLLKHSSLPDGDGLVIAPSSGIHTFFMKFPIDVVFVARDGRVLKTRSNLGPWRVAICWRAHAVVEIPAGALARSNTAPGDILEVSLD